MIHDSSSQKEPRSLFLIDSYLLLAIALAAGMSYHPAIVSVIVASLFSLWLGVARPSALPGWHLHTLSLSGLAVLLWLNDPAETSAEHFVMSCRAASVPMLILVAFLESGSAKTRRIVLVLAGLLKLGLILWGLRVVSHPSIDVWHLQQRAVEILLQGKNPYSTPVDDIYAGGIAFGHQKYYAYAPLNLLLSIPAKVCFGDYRYGLLTALTASLLLFRQTGNRLGVWSHRIDLLTMAALLHPRLDRLVIYGWLEPYLILLLSLFVYLYVCGKRGLLPTMILFAMPLLKQYVAVPLLLYLLLLRPPLVAICWSALLGVIMLSPLLLSNFSATLYHGFLFFVQSLGFRPDSLSIAALVFNVSGHQMGVKTALGVQLLSGLLAAHILRKDSDRLTAFLMSSALSLIASFLFAPQAFVNYYFFAGVIVLWAALCASPTQNEQAPARLPSLPSQLRRALLILGLTASTVYVSHLVFDWQLCPRTTRISQQKRAEGKAILDEGIWVARPTEQIHLCESEHCVWPLCHQDERCLCADRTTFPTEQSLEAQLRARGQQHVRCQLDHATSDVADRTGSCWRARCHVRIE
jgi:hypothetical protein